MRTILCAGLLALCGALPTFAQEVPNPILQSNSNAIWFGNWIGMSKAILRVASPDGRIETVVAENQSPSYQLAAPVADGYYRFELRADTDDFLPVENEGKAMGADEERPDTRAVTFYKTGGFLVERGVIVPLADMPLREES